MDVVLEITDTFIADYVYAWAHPASKLPFDYSGLSANGSVQTSSPWQYTPATSYINFEPSHAAYESQWYRDNPYRQAITLFLITWIFGLLNYFFLASLSYLFVFDKETFKHPKFLKNQMWMEIAQANWGMPGMAACTMPVFWFEVRGYSKLYDVTEEGPGMWYNILQFPIFLIFTDCCIYFIHRGLHHPLVYKRLHKPHHKWIMPTPFASHAFHPLDGFAQSIPYHIFPFFFPLQKMAYVFLFVFVNFWTILIHDGEFYADNAIINGAACHSVHHLAFNYNYGQYTTLWDRLGGSYRKPDRGMFDKETKISETQWKKQVKEMEDIVKDVEGDDDRVYDSKKTQ